MAEIWNFSPCLEAEVQLCLSAAKNKPNKWLRAFGSIKNKHNLDTTKSSNKIDNTDVNAQKDSKFIILNDEEDCITDNKTEINTEITIQAEKFEEFCELIENEITSRFELLVIECLKNHTLLRELATRLSLASIEKLCKSIYDCKQNHNTEFIKLYFKYFLPALVKREYNCFTLDLIIKGSQTYPLHFKEFLSEIIRDTEVPNKVLLDYLATLNEEEKSKSILGISELDMSPEQFIHNLYAITTTYKDCKKTENIQNCICSLLLQYSQAASMDRNYGRLFLTYLQAQRALGGQINNVNLEKAIECHQSPLRRLCVTLLNELREKHLDHNSEDDENSDSE